MLCKIEYLKYHPFSFLDAERIQGLSEFLLSLLLTSRRIWSSAFLREPNFEPSHLGFVSDPKGEWWLPALPI